MYLESLKVLMANMEQHVIDDRRSFDRVEEAHHRTESTILAALNEIKKEQKEQAKQINLCRVDIASLKVKSGLWGAAAGAIPVILGLVVWLVGLP
jgi:hypothetical protein